MYSCAYSERSVCVRRETVRIHALRLLSHLLCLLTHCCRWALLRALSQLAIQQGAAVVPAFVFGEKFLYHRRQIPQAIQNFFMRTLRLPLILFWGRWFTWLAYHDRERAFLTVVFGKPIDVVQKDEPTDAEIDVIWEQYIGQIRSLYDEHHKKFGYSDEETLVIKEADDEKRKRARATANGSALSPKSPDSNGSSRTTRTSRSSSSSSSKKKKKN